VKPERFIALVLVSTSLLLPSCGPPPEDASTEDASTEDASTGSSQGRPREEASITAPPPETTMEASSAALEATSEKATKNGPKPVQQPEQKPEPAGEVVEVEISGLAYRPVSITVSPGTTVRWVNEDRALHTVTSEEPGGPLGSEELGRGDSYEYTFREEGRYDYYCVVHPFMKSGVTVG
jgi:plastocyanin